MGVTICSGLTAAQQGHSVPAVRLQRVSRPVDPYAPHHCGAPFRLCLRAMQAVREWGLGGCAGSCVKSSRCARPVG